MNGTVRRRVIAQLVAAGVWLLVAAAPAHGVPAAQRFREAGETAIARG